MDEAEHDIKNYAGREVFYLAKAESDKCFLFIQNISNYKTTLPRS